MLGGADNPNGELLSYIIGADISAIGAENPPHFGSSAFISASVSYKSKRRQVWQNVTYSYGESGYIL